MSRDEKLVDPWREMIRAEYEKIGRSVAWLNEMGEGVAEDAGDACLVVGATFTVDGHGRVRES